MATSSDAQQCECDAIRTLSQQNNENITLCDDSQQQSLSGTINDDQNVNTRNDMELIRSQPNTSLNSAKTFEEFKLQEQLLKGLNEMGFNAPTILQQKALPLMLAIQPNNVLFRPNNLIVQSHYRTGKTVAFILASLCRIDTQLNYPQVIIVLPTNESVIQTGKVVQRMAKYVPEIKFRSAVIGDNVARGGRVFEHVIIGTPGKIMDLTKNSNLFDRNQIKLLVGNDSDILIDKREYRQKIIRIQERLSLDCQMIYLSDTYHENLKHLPEVIIRNPVIIRHKCDEEILDNINQYYVVFNTHYWTSSNFNLKVLAKSPKYDALVNICQTIPMAHALVFCDHEGSYFHLEQNLALDFDANISSELIDNWLTNIQRTKRLKQFRNFSAYPRVLILNNVDAICLRDMDVGFVVNYDLPINMQTKQLDKDMYFRRISRTGKVCEKRVVINFVESPETHLMVKELEKHFGREISILNVNDSEDIKKIYQI